MNKNNYTELFVGDIMDVFIEKDNFKAYSIIQDILDNVHLVDNRSFSEGLTGIAWAICNFLNKNNYDDSILINFDELILNFTIKSFKNKDYDYLYGGFGGLLYFIERGNLKYLKIITQTIDGNISTFNKADVFFDLEKVKDGKIKILNLSLGHGMASFIAICNIAINEGLLVEWFTLKLKKLLKFYIKNICTNKPSFLPNYMIENKPIEYNKRLAWCWGDLGVFYQLLVSSKLLNKQNEFKIIENVLLKLAKYSFDDAAIYDSCLCHGSSGIAYIFFKIFLITNNIKFKKIYNKWLGITENILEEYNNCFYNPYDEKWQIDKSFLNGTKGVFLVQKTIKGEIDSSWDRCLLLS